MATVREILQADLKNFRDHAAALEARIEALPVEVQTLSEEAWEHIKGLFGMGSKATPDVPAATPPAPPAPPAA